ncbi:hypothetical protein ACFLWA_02795 [Chloroflexota bacterium]
MTGRSLASWRFWLLIAILLAAFGLRMHRLGADSLWYDETVSVHLAGKSIPALISHTARDIHPPGYYLLLHAWGLLAGQSEFVAAFLSLFFGILLVALAYVLGARVFGPGAGLLAAFLVALSPFNLWYSQEVRMYTLGAALGMVLLTIVVGLVTQPRCTLPPWTRLLAYALFGAAGLWVLHYFAFLLLAVNLMVIGWWLHNRLQKSIQLSWLMRWMLAQAVALLLYAPWLPVAWRQATTPPVPPWRGFTPLGVLLLETWTALSLGQSAEFRWAWPLLLLTGFLFALGLFYGLRSSSASMPAPPSDKGDLVLREGGARRTMALFLAGYVALPIVLIYLVSFVSPLYHVRYIFTYSTPLYIMLGAGLLVLGRWWKPAMWLALAAVLGFSVWSIWAFFSNPTYSADDHRGATKFLSERWRPGDAILVNAGYAYTAPVTYWRGDPIERRGRLVGLGPDDDGQGPGPDPVLLQTGTVGGEPSLGWGDARSDFYAMSEANTEQALAELLANYERIWVYRIYDTVTDPGAFVREWLADNTVQFEDQVFSGEAQLRIQGFSSGEDTELGADVPIDATLTDGSLRLSRAEPLAPAVEVGNALDLALLWRVEGRLVEGAVLFAGLFDEQGRRWAQTDERPLGALLPSDGWPSGATVRTPLRVPIPSETPPGSYQLKVGWYRFVDGQPIWIPWVSGDLLPLGDIDVVPPSAWWSLQPSRVGWPVDISVGPGVRLLGFDAQSLEAQPGDSLELELVWQATEDSPHPAAGVLQLRDASGDVVFESQSAPVGSKLPFPELAAGQAVRDPRSLQVPGHLAPGVYDLYVGRRTTDGAWLPIRRGVAPLGSTYPLASVRVHDRQQNYVPPGVQHAASGRFGDGIRFVGCDASPEILSHARDGRQWRDLELTVHWQARSSMSDSHKVFLHVSGVDDPSKILAQSDLSPRSPTTAWKEGEYLRDRIQLDLPDDLDPGIYTLLLGFYDERSGARLPAANAAGHNEGGSLDLGQVHLGGN